MSHTSQNVSAHRVSELNCKRFHAVTLHTMNSLSLCLNAFAVVVTVVLSCVLNPGLKVAREICHLTINRNSKLALTSVF